MLCLTGGHELKPAPDDLLRAWQPAVYVIARTCEHGDAIAKGQARVHHVKALLPNTKIGVRWGADPAHYDNQQSSRITPQQYAADFFRLHIPGTLLMPDNEAAASATDPDVYRRVVAWWVDVVRLATDAGVTLGIGCTPTGVPDYPQYALLTPLFRAMRDAAQRGVVHWWRPNAYFVPTDSGRSVHHVQRHQREGRRVCREAGLPFPPFFLGEFSPIGSYHDAEYGFRRLGWHGARAAQAVMDEGLTDPHCFYSVGEGIYDSKWWAFNALDPGDMSFFPAVTALGKRVPDTFITQLEAEYREAARRSMADQFPPTGALAWRGRVTGLPAGIGWRNIRTRPVTGEDVGDLRVGDAITYYPQDARDGWVFAEKDGARGWVLWTGVTVDGAPVITPPPQIPDGMYTPWLSADEIQQAITLHSTIAEAHNALAALYRTALYRTALEDTQTLLAKYAPD